MQFGFEDSGTTTTDSASGIRLDLMNYAGSATDYHGAAGSGVYNHGRALNFSSGTLSGNGPVAFTTNNATIDFGTLTNFTVAMWIKTSANLAFGLPRFFILGTDGVTNGSVTNSLQLLNNNKAMRLDINTRQINSPTLSEPTNQWIFLAATWDGQSQRFYSGSESEAVQLVGSVTSTTGPVNVGPAFSLFLGNYGGRNRSFAGWMDDVRFYTGAASSADLEGVRQEAWVPTPPTNVTLSTCSQAWLNWSAVPGATHYIIKRSLSTLAETNYATNSTASYVDTNVTVGATYYYQVVAANDYVESAASAEVSGAVEDQDAFSFVSQPADQTVSNGSTATFSVTLSGGSGLAYLWQVSVDGGGSWSDLAGATNTTYTTAPLSSADNGAQYRMLVQTSCGNVQSAVAHVTVNTTFVTVPFTYASTVSTNTNGLPLQLTAELDYVSSRSNMPIMVVMHPFSDLTGQFAAYRDNARRFNDLGFFTILPAMRQREGSEGIRDNGGVEIYDIYDAVEAVKAAFPALVNSNSISITGYSGGGGNTMSALTKFPDYFRVGAAYFGMSDYGYNTNSGWYFYGSAASHQAILNAAPGNPTSPGASVVIDSYLARASNLASKNNPYSEIHLFVNNNEPICPKINDTSFRDNALAAASFPGEFTNITVHIGASGLFQDFNGNGINEADEEQYWPHSDPTAAQQHAGDAWYLDRLLAGQIPEPSLNATDTLFVAGFVKTKRFALWLGDGQNAAAELIYSLAPSSNRFELHLVSVNAVTGRLSVDTASMTNRTVHLRRNGVLVESFPGGGVHVINGINDGEVIELTAVPRLQPVFTSVNLNAATGDLMLTWTSEAGATYTFESSSELAPAASWAVVDAAIPSAGSSTTYTQDTTSAAQRFYRVKAN